jgi:glycosyltransferase involved in cell wall biosynthesis
VSIVPAPPSTAGFAVRALWREVHLRRLVGRSAAEAVISTVPELPVVALPVPAVMVVHDVGAAVAPALYGTAKRLRYELLLRAALHRADRVVCVSHATLLDLHRWSGISPDRCAVIGNAPQTMGLRAVGSRDGQTGPFLLLVGNLYGNKNTGTILQAMAMLRDRGTSLRLEMVGPLQERERRRLADDVARLGLADVVHHRGFVDPETLSTLYRGAAAVLYPSLYEGQGIPVLEASSLGTRIIASDLRSIREAPVGDITLVQRPLDADAWADVIAAPLPLMSLRAPQEDPPTWEGIGGAMAEMLRDCRDARRVQRRFVSSSEKRYG